MTTINSNSRQYFNDETSFRAALTKLSSASSLSINSEGNLAPASLFFDLFSSSVINNRRMLELKVMEFLVQGKKWLKPDDINLIDQLASKVGLFMKKPDTGNRHKELRTLINLIVKEILQYKAVSPKDYLKIQQDFQKRYHRILSPYSEQCEQVKKSFEDALRTQNESTGRIFEKFVGTAPVKKDVPVAPVGNTVHPVAEKIGIAAKGVLVGIGAFASGVALYNFADLKSATFKIFKNQDLPTDSSSTPYLLGGASVLAALAVVGTYLKKSGSLDNVDVGASLGQLRDKAGQQIENAKKAVSNGFSSLMNRVEDWRIPKTEDQKTDSDGKGTDQSGVGDGDSKDLGSQASLTDGQDKSSNETPTGTLNQTGSTTGANTPTIENNNNNNSIVGSTPTPTEPEKPSIDDLFGEPTSEKGVVAYLKSFFADGTKGKISANIEEIKNRYKNNSTEKTEIEGIIKEVAKTANYIYWLATNQMKANDSYYSRLCSYFSQKNSNELDDILKVLRAAVNESEKKLIGLSSETKIKNSQQEIYACEKNAKSYREFLSYGKNQFILNILMLCKDALGILKLSDVRIDEKLQEANAQIAHIIGEKLQLKENATIDFSSFAKDEMYIMLGMLSRYKQVKEGGARQDLNSSVMYKDINKGFTNFILGIVPQRLYSGVKDGKTLLKEKIAIFERESSEWEKLFEAMPEFETKLREVFSKPLPNQAISMENSTLLNNALLLGEEEIDENGKLLLQLIGASTNDKEKTDDVVPKEDSKSKLNVKNLINSQVQQPRANEVQNQVFDKLEEPDTTLVLTGSGTK